LTRSPKDFYQLIELFEQYGVDFISVTERFDTSTPSGRLLRNIMLTFAQFERELASERTRDKLFERAQKGMWNGGIIPLGYRSEDKKLVVKRAEAKLVRTLYQNYINGDSIAEIAESLKISKSRAFTILRNAIYIGKVKFAGKLMPGIHQPIISEDTFNLAQKMHKKKVRKMRLYKDYAFAGLIKCKECGSVMTPCHTNKKRNNRTRHYYYYRCTSTFKRKWDTCKTREVNADRLESYILENLKRISQDRHYLDSLIFKLNNSCSGDRIGLPETRSARSGQAHYNSSSPQHKREASGDHSGLEPRTSARNSAKISGEIFAQTLQHFVKIVPQTRGFEKNLWAKKFIKSIKYCKEEIAVSIYYKGSSEEAKDLHPASGRVGAAAGRSVVSLADKKITPISTDRGNHQEWLPGEDSNLGPSGYDLTYISARVGLSLHPEPSGWRV
ncbi:MAG: recombinase family protein, partial [Candidatus Omnitrophica bacterium]|nr:recombinase family protein [Candidatus Omnitrophota bacterium]